jgi:hypothetical protein
MQIQWYWGLGERLREHVPELRRALARLVWVVVCVGAMGRGESLDDHHGAATFGTKPKRARFLGRGGWWLGARRL